MFKSKTVFVIGAGASADFGFPIGGQLTSQIARLLNISYRFGRELTSGDENIAVALDSAASELNTSEYELQQSAKKVATAMPLAVSIDNFLEAHAQDQGIKACGKLGITRAILQAERASALYIDRQNPRQMNFSDPLIANSWHLAFVQRLWEGAGASRLTEIFENVSFVIFNYDRCVETFLLNALPAYYLVSKEEVANVLREVTFLHPYGAVGMLPWQTQKASGIEFGANLHGSSLRNVSKNIRVFTEQFESPEFERKVNDVFVDARNIVFLGFSYLEQNMRLLSNKSVDSSARVYGTALNISYDDRDVVSALIVDSFNVAPDNVRLINDKCQTLFSQFSRSISQ